jgi:hypothetical protein
VKNKLPTSIKGRKENMKKTTFIIVLAAFAVFLLSAAQPARTAEMDDQQAMDILQKMARTLAAAKQFSFTLHSSYDAPQSNGQMVEFGALRQIQVKRPDKLRVDVQKSDGDQRIMVFDGQQIIIQNVTDNIYAKAEKAGSIDDAVKYLVGVLKTPLPLARMFLANLPAELERLVEKIDYVEQNMLTDVVTDHLAVRGRDVDFQIWIAQGKEVLPRRMVITYKNFRGDPQHRADFSNWNFSDKGVKGPFTFSPPKNAEEVPLLIRNRAEAGIPTGQGGAK